MRLKLWWIIMSLAMTLAFIPASVDASYPAEAGKFVTDQWIVDTLKFIMENDFRLDPTRIEVSSQNGLVTLEGTVFTEFEKAHAELLATGVLGVRGIINDLLVVQPLDEDLALMKQVRWEILQHPLLNVSHLNVSVRGGMVQLHGIVFDARQKAMIDQVVQWLPGAKRITNHIVVLPAVSGNVR
jgi:osmotically-inducible protein OsmY